MNTATAAQDEFDALFAANHKGKQHPEDDDDASSVSSKHSAGHSPDSHSGKRGLSAGKKALTGSEDDEDSDRQTPASSSKMKTRYFLPRSHRSDANTGPKGVIADAYAFETAKKNVRRRSFLPSRQSFKPSAPPVQYRRDAEKSDVSEEDDEDDFMQHWRQSRLKELQQQSIPGVGARRASPSGGGRRWGAVQHVDAVQYLDAVEDSPRGTVVVVLIFDEKSEVSTMVEDIFRSLASKYSSSRFIRLNYEEAEFEQMGVPAILAYRNGEKFADMVPVVNEIPEEHELDITSLETAMKKHQILS